MTVASTRRRIAVSAGTAAVSAAVALAASACSASGLDHGAPVLAAPAGGTSLLATMQGVVWSFQPGRSPSVVRGWDRGQRWQVVLTNQGAGADLAAGYFLGPGEAWAVTQQPGAAGRGPVRTILATTNGGRHWFRGGPLPGAGRLPGYVGHDEIYFADAKHGWLLSAGTSPGDGGRQRLMLWSTADGGHVWTPVPSRGLPLQAARLDWTGTSQGDCPDRPVMTFANPLDGWLTLGPCGARRTAPRVWRTADGGRRWTAVALPAPEGGWSAWYGTGRPPGLHFPGSVRMTGVTVGPVRIAASGISAIALVSVALGRSKLVIFRSGDGGRTWRIVARLHTGTRPARTSPACWFDPISATDWVVNASGLLIETTDGGRHWHYIRSRSHLPGAVASFIKLNDGYEQGPGFTIRRTKDSGRYWMSEPVPQ